jgi:phage terminase small subunit
MGTKRGAGKTTNKRTPKRTAPVQEQSLIVIEDTERLTDKEAMFIDQYFINKLNGTEAAWLTYDCKSRAVASVIASELLAKPKIRTRVDARLDQYHMAADELLARIAADARGTMEYFIDPGSGVIDLKKAAEANALGLLKRYKTKFITTTRTTGRGESAVTEEIETAEVEVELYDAQAARRDIGKHLGLFAADSTINFNFLQNASDDDLKALASGKPIKTVNVEAQK